MTADGGSFPFAALSIKGERRTGPERSECREPVKWRMAVVRCSADAVDIYAAVPYTQDEMTISLGRPAPSVPQRISHVGEHY